MILHITIEEMVSFVQILKNLCYILVIEHRHKENIVDEISLTLLLMNKFLLIVLF